MVTGGRVTGNGATAAWDLEGVNEGTYMAIVTVTDKNGHTATSSALVDVKNCMCVAPKATP